MTLKIEKGVPLYSNSSTELLNVLLSLKHDESVYIPYSEYKKTTSKNAIASARIRILEKSLKLITKSDGNGIRVWAYHKNKMPKK